MDPSEHLWGWLLWSLDKEWGDELKTSISGCYGRKPVMNVRREMFTCGQEYNPV